MASQDEHIEKPIGTVDGVNRSFVVLYPYESGTVKLWKNGILVRAGDDDGFDELGGISIETREAPLTGDKLTVRYLEL